MPGVEQQAGTGTTMRKKLTKIKSAAALMGNHCDIVGNPALGGSRSATALVPMDHTYPRRKPITRKPVGKYAKKLLKRESALDTAMAEMAKLIGTAAIPEGAVVGAETAAVIEKDRLEALARQPVVQAGPESETPRMTPAEQRHALHNQLAAKVETLTKKLEVVTSLTERVEKSVDPRLKERTRVHQNVTQGLELMEELAKQAKIDACERAIRFRDAESKKPGLPHFIQILKNDGLKCDQMDSLNKADDIIKRFARPMTWKGRNANGPAGTDDAPRSLDRAFDRAPPSPLGSRYRYFNHTEKPRPKRRTRDQCANLFSPSRDATKAAAAANRSRDQCANLLSPAARGAAPTSIVATRRSRELCANVASPTPPRVKGSQIDEINAAADAFLSRARADIEGILGPQAPLSAPVPAV